MDTNKAKQHKKYNTQTVQITPDKSITPHLGVREGDRVIGVPGGEDGGVGEDDVEVRDERAQLELLEVALFWVLLFGDVFLGWVVGVGVANVADRINVCFTHAYTHTSL